jgi:hypothetical protein
MIPPNDAIRFYVETRLREAVNRREVVMSALAMLKVGVDIGEPPDDVMRKVLADFALVGLGLEIRNGEVHQSGERREGEG